MALPLTVDILQAAYDFLCTTPPFNKWNLPDGEDVKFKVGKSTVYCAWVDKADRKLKFTIFVSQASTGHAVTLLAHMAHEMIHVYQFQTNTDTPNSAHNAAFRKLAAQVCKVHGFDLRTFY